MSIFDGMASLVPLLGGAAVGSAVTGALQYRNEVRKEIRNDGRLQAAEMLDAASQLTDELIEAQLNYSVWDEARREEQLRLLEEEGRDVPLEEVGGPAQFFDRYKEHTAASIQARRRGWLAVQQLRILDLDVGYQANLVMESSDIKSDAASGGLPLVRASLERGEEVERFADLARIAFMPGRPRWWAVWRRGDRRALKAARAARLADQAVPEPEQAPAD